MTTLKWLLAIAVVLFIALWLVLAAPMFSSFRQGIVENLMTDQLGQPFEIDGDVRIVLKRTARVRVADARVPSTNMDDLDLIALTLMELDVDLLGVLRGNVALDNFVMDGLQVNLLTAEDGTTSWIQREGRIKKKDEEDTKEDSPSFLTFLSDKTVTFTNIGLTIDNATSGFVFDFDLESALLEQHEKLVTFSGHGSVNGEEFELLGNYPHDAPFSHDVSFGELSLTYNGTVLPESEGGGYVADFDLETGEIGEIFDIFGLERSVEGHGRISTEVTRKPDVWALADIESTFELDGGQHIVISGKVDNVLPRDGVDITIDARMHPEGAPPPPATALKDLKLTGIDAHIITGDQGLEFEELNIQTNAFDQGLDRVGPITIGQFYRSPEGTLGVREITLQVGPLDAPFITASGSVSDVFKFKGVSIEGALQGASTLLLRSLAEEDAERFGRVYAEFDISDDPGHLSLRRLEARSENTDLWSLDAKITMEDVKKLSGFLLELSLSVADSAHFLEALQVDPIDVGALGLTMGMTGDKQNVSLDIGFNAADSDISTNITFDISQDINVIRGGILSNRIRLADIRDGTKAVIAIAGSSKSREAEETDQPPLQPLVLDETPVKQEPEIDDGKPPLQPLVIEQEPAPEEKFFSPQRILTKTDLEISIDLKEFVGDKGVSSMSSQLIADQGQIQAGPMELYYGDGFFRVNAEMDAVNQPEILIINGSTSGWDLGEILTSLELGIEAQGTLDAALNISGNISQPKNFARTITGAATLNMGNGAVATSLLELAGLGIFPWLFSEERRKGWTDVVCVRAPVQLNTGKVTFDRVVVETNSVQLFARGAVDWINDSIKLRAEPRRVGKPLSRSAWPFEVTGKLSDPKFKLDIGGSRSRRADGASVMPADRVPCIPDIYQLEQGESE